MFALMPSSRALDSFWLAQDHQPRSTKEAARQISDKRPLDGEAVALACATMESIFEIADFLDELNFIISPDQAERIAFIMINMSWQSAFVSEVVELSVPRQLKTAIIRQLLRQGDEHRVDGFVQWLTTGNGQTAGGGIILDDAFQTMVDFDAALRLANRVSSVLRRNQIAIIARRLSVLARTKSELGAFERYKERFVVRD